MEWRWLKRSGASNLVVVFGGWALGRFPYLNLGGSQDVLLAQDFRMIDGGMPAEPKDYTTVSLVAFSFGVAAYAFWQLTEPEVFSRKVAVNGTLAPVDRRNGIPPIVFHRTVETLSQDSLRAFCRRCYDGSFEIDEHNLDHLRDELNAVQDRGAAPTRAFDRIWVSNQDKVLPAANQLRAWAEQSGKVRRLDAPHVPFSKFRTWDEVLD